MMTTTLAMSDGALWAMWIIGLCVGVGQLIFNLIAGYIIASLLRKSERIDQLEAKAESSAKEIVNQQMATMGKEYLGLVELLKQRVDQVFDRLKAGDRDFKDLNERDHQLEVKFNLRIEQLKDWMRETFATKHHADALQRQLDTMRSNGAIHGH